MKKLYFSENKQKQKNKNKKKKKKTTKKKKQRQFYCPINVNNNFLPSNRIETRTYSALKTERFRMMFIVWRSVLKGL